MRKEREKEILPNEKNFIYLGKGSSLKMRTKKKAFVFGI